MDEFAAGQEAAMQFDALAEDVLALQIERRIEQLSARPRIYQVDSFLSDEECLILQAWDRPESAASVARNPAVAAVHRRMHCLHACPLDTGSSYRYIDLGLARNKLVTPILSQSTPSCGWQQSSPTFQML